MIESADRLLGPRRGRSRESENSIVNPKSTREQGIRSHCSDQPRGCLIHGESQIRDGVEIEVAVCRDGGDDRTDEEELVDPGR
nr:hypothetical protein [Rhodococcus maanshanensis]